MQQDTPIIPQTLAQWLYILLVTFLGGGGIGAGLTTWLRRKHGPAEVRKIDAETRSIIIRDDIALGDSVSRLIKEVAQAALDAEQRRQEWLLQEEQLRAKVLFWRSKAEELDGELTDSREVNVVLQAQAKVDNYQLDKQMNFIKMKNLKDEYIALDRPKE